MSKFIGRRIVPKHDGVWDINKEYEELSIVLDKASGESYISRRPVPVGTAISDEIYWMQYSLYSAQIAEAVKEMEDTEARLIQYVDTAESNMNSRVNSAESLTNSNKAELNSRMDTLDKRLDANVSASTDKDKDYAAEVVDARVDEEGTKYGSVGSHIRAIGSGKGILKGAVNGSRLSFLDITPELVWTADKYISRKYGGLDNFSQGSNVYFATLDYIPFPYGGCWLQVYSAMSTVESDKSGIAFYDANKKFISGSDYNRETKKLAFRRIFCPDGTAYIRMSCMGQDNLNGVGIWLDDYRISVGHAMDGKLDYIVTKSISRFARNTIDSLTCTRELRQLKPPVGIYFEKENIDTLDAKGELILTILSALAQDESRSISDNIRWSIQKKFQSGVPHINLKRMLGYELGANKQWVIVPEQAEIIRYIFDRFVKGQTANKIALELNQMEKFTVNGKKWSAGSILIVLRNEKYVGDIEMQKTITKDFLTHRSSINKGEAPRYYVKNHHVGIIDRVTWDKVQTMLFEKPRADMTKGPGKKKVKSIKGSPFGNLRCGAILENGPDAGKPCGEGFFRTTYTGVANGYSDERSLKATGEDTGEYLEKYTYSYPVWRCKRKVGERDGEPPKNGSPDQKAYCRSKKGCMSDEEKEAANKRCPSERYHECALEQSFMELLYSMKRDFEQHGDASMIVAMFDNAYEQAVRLANNNSISVQRMATVENQIKEMEERLQDAISHQVAALREAALEQNVELNEALSNGEVTIDDIDLDIRSGLTPGSIGVSFYGTETEEGSEAQIYTELVNDLQERLKTLQQERQTIEEEQGVLAIMKKNFEYFLACLKELPDTNAGGMPLRVNGLDVQGTLLRDVDGNAIEGRKRAITSGKLKLTPERIAEAPDMLHFEKGIYCAFVESGVLQGDVATYKTNFGVTLTSKGNRRTLDSFMGYKRSDMDGNVVYVDAPYKVYGFSIQYRRYLTTAAKREREEAV